MTRIANSLIAIVCTSLAAAACGSVTDGTPDGGASAVDATGSSIDAMAAAPDAMPPDAGPQLLSIEVTPAAANLLLGATQQYTATGTYTDGPQDITTLVTWGTAASAVATITSAGIVTGVSINDTTVAASLDGISGETALSVLGLGSMEFPGAQCREIVASGSSVGDGQYWIDPTGTDPFLAYCDMTTDNGGWTLLAWNGQTDLGTPTSVPYPGLDACPDFTCQRGSAASQVRMQPLIRTGSEFAKAQSATAVASFGPLADYTYAGKYVYGSLAALTMVYGANTCSGTTPFATGVYTSMVGPNTFDGKTVYLADALGTNGGSTYDYSSDANSYFWSVGTEGAACAGCTGGCDIETYMGTASTTQYGPFEQGAGAHSVWVR